MAIEARIRELGKKRETLEQAIEDEIRRPAADAIRLGELKRKKLRLKEEITSLQSRAQ